MRQPREAAAIIVSQDGNLSLAIKDQDSVVQVIGSYDHAFGWR
jgi:protein-arginine kinase